MNDRLLDALRPVPAPTSLLPSVLDAAGLTSDRYVIRPSPIGDVLVAFNDRGISACLVADGRADDEVVEEFFTRFGRRCVAEPSPSQQLVEAIDRAIAGDRPPSLSFDLRTTSDFQRDVLAKAAEIPPGEVRPYGWIAAEIGRPGAVRAVGTALGRNPVPLLIPCHRVVRSDGRIGDYAFGSPAKQAVLRAEGIDPPWLERLADRGVRFLGDAGAGTFCHPTCTAVRDVTGGAVELRSVDDALARGLQPCARCRPLAGAAAA